MAALDLFGRRWVLRVLWELRDGGESGFRPLQARCDGMSSSVLSRRLVELEAARLVERGPQPGAGYRLTAFGREAVEALGGLSRWADRWAADVPSDATPAPAPRGD
jgi:DNA-binding HxlR family transcriptional regulator